MHAPAWILSRVDRMQLGRRRMIPIFVSIVFGSLAFAPILLPGLFTDDLADKYTIGFTSVIFFAKVSIFAVMRQRMTIERRPLTTFGLALIDFFAGLIIQAMVFAIVFGLLFVLALHGELVGNSLRLVNRAAIAMAGAYTVGAGIAVLWEIKRAGLRLAVHQDDQGTNYWSSSGETS